MNSMPLVQIHGVDDVRLDRVPEPEHAADDVLVRVAACGICGSDLGYIAMGGLTPPGQPMPLGHELSGVVAAVGANVTHLEIGQRVVVNPTANGTDIGNGGPEGGFAPLLRVTGVAQHPASVLPLPDHIGFHHGALVEPLAVAMHGVNQSGIQPGQSAMVFGAGPIGLCTVIVLRYFGVENIVVADQSPHRLDIARQLGASSTCNVKQQNLNELLRQEQGEALHYGMPVAGTDVYIEATGVGAVLEQAIALARPGARVVVLGVHKAPIQLNPLDLLIKELHLIGSMAYPEEFPAVIEMLASGAVDISALISHQFELQDFMQALAVAKNPQLAAKVMININQPC
ncbi:MAG: zinc-binding dehydrogenase [Gammaproteobacteria bacterium]|nr:zinc-binding dehydrogenase [Gammaproteobacteria bacterium]